MKPADVSANVVVSPFHCPPPPRCSYERVLAAPPSAEPRDVRVMHAGASLAHMLLHGLGVPVRDGTRARALAEHA